jgi:hypothetical protein
MAPANHGRAQSVVRWLRANWIPLTHLALCAAVIAPISSQPGWPLAHDVHPLFQRVEAFRREFAAGNLFPLWTPFGNLGHGMPMPLFYHRLFNTVAGLLALFVGTVSAVKVAFVPTLAVGATGMAAAAEELGCPPWIRLWSGAVLPLAHYTFVNWLIRGSAAELTAGMLIPWLVVPCLRMQSGKPFGARLGAILVLLFFAHVSICLYSVFLVAVAVICCVVGGRRAPAATARYLARGLGIGAVIVALGAGPTALAIWLVGPEFCLDRLALYVPQRQIVPDWTLYFVDNLFPWGQTWHGIDFEISRFVIGSLLVTAIIALAKRKRFRAQTFAFLAAGAVVYFWFQLPMAEGFYKSVKISQILQFPWRLLVYVTPLVILMTAVLARAVFELGGRWALAAAGILAVAWGAQANFARAPYRIAYEWVAPQFLAAEVASLDVGTGADEFLPAGLADPPPPRDLVQLDGCTLASSNVDLRRLTSRAFETLELHLESSAGCTMHFSQFWTTLVRVRASAGARVVRAPDQTTDVLLPPGASTVQIDRRGVLRSIGHAIRQRLERRRAQ